MSVYFFIYSIGVKISSNDSRLISKLSKDFFSYLSDSETFRTSEYQLNINSNVGSVPRELIPSVKPLWSRDGVVTRDFNGKRYCLYDDALLSVVDFEKEHASLFSEELDLLHEITYLLVLSRLGKRMDLQGYHRLHAFGVQRGQKSLLGVFPSGHGKTTMLFDLLKEDKELSWFSDDTPLIDSIGRVYPFQLRLGVNEQITSQWDFEEKGYRLRRRKFGVKTLLSTEHFLRSQAMGGLKGPLIIVFGRRFKSREVNLRRCSFLRAYFELLISLVIGYGTPQIFEYFWIRGPRDFLVKSKIALMRLRAAYKLVQRAQVYWIDLSEEPKVNAEAVKRLIS